MNVQVAIRWVLTLVLLCGIYTETGLWTTLTFVLLFLTGELEARMRDG